MWTSAVLAVKLENNLWYFWNYNNYYWIDILLEHQMSFFHLTVWHYIFIRHWTLHGGTVTGSAKMCRLIQFTSNNRPLTDKGNELQNVKVNVKHLVESCLALLRYCLVSLDAERVHQCFVSQSSARAFSLYMTLAAPLLLSFSPTCNIYFLAWFLCECKTSYM